MGKNMKKYVFKNQALENAFRVLAKALEIEDFDKQFKESLDDELPYFSFYRKNEEKPVFSFSANLLECIEVYDPNGWNDQKITPPRFAHFRYSQPYLVETEKSHFVEGVFDFDSETWHENRNNTLVSCSRYREMPVGFFER